MEALAASIVNSYIVLLKEDTAVSTENHLSWINDKESEVASLASRGASDPTFEVRHTYDEFRAYSATLTETALQTLRDCGDVEDIIADSIVHICSDAPGGPAHTLVFQDNAPWGLQRASSGKPLPAGSSPGDLTYKYRWASSANETPVDVYVLDTGVSIKHEEFQGRARWGQTFGGYDDVDRHGHGTHVAGTIAGKQFGVAKNASIVAVKVLGDDGSGRTSDIMAGMDWAVKEAERTGKAGVINMSLGGAGHIGLDRAATRATTKGVHVCVAAGNEAENASNTSPARAKGVITVGATNITDKFAEFSNFGKPVDILAPGERIISASIDSLTASTSKSGTSMATPHVAGMVAWLISLEGNRKPAEMIATLQKRSSRDMIPDVPKDTVNLLLNNGL